MKSREEILESIKSYLKPKLGEFLGNDRIEQIFSGSCTSSYFKTCKKLQNFDLHSLESFFNFVLEENKDIPGFENNNTLLSEVIFNEFQDNDISLVCFSNLHTNLIQLEEYCTEENSAIKEYKRELFLEDLKEVIKLEKLDNLKELVEKHKEKLLSEDEEEYYENKFLNNPKVGNDILIKMYNILFASKISTLSIQNLSYNLFLRLRKKELKVQTYDQLTKFSLFKDCII